MMLFLGLAAGVAVARGQSLRGSSQIQANQSIELAKSSKLVFDKVTIANSSDVANERIGFARSAKLALDNITVASGSDTVLGLSGGACAYHLSMASAAQCAAQAKQIPAGWVHGLDDSGTVCMSASSRGCYDDFDFFTRVRSFDECSDDAKSSSYAYSCYDASSQLCFVARDTQSEVLLQNMVCTSDDDEPAAPAPVPDNSDCVYVGAAWYKCAGNSGSPGNRCQSVGSGWWVCQP